MRLKIWRKLSPTADCATNPDAGVVGLDVGELYASEAPRLRRRLLRRFAPDKAADLVQTAFVRVLGLGSDRLDTLEQPRAYLNRVADNLANDHDKSAAHRLERGLPEEWSVMDDPHAALEARDMLRRIEKGIALLPDRTREIFMAHRFEDLTYDEIAEQLGISVKTVEKHISAALQTLHRRVRTQS